MHLDIIKRLTLTQIVVISRGQQSRSVASNNGFQVSAMDVEGHSFESVHFRRNPTNWGTAKGEITNQIENSRRKIERENLFGEMADHLIM